jgi:hypothetical protein
MIGVAYVLPDDALARVFQRLYAWAAPGSLLALTGFAAGSDIVGMQDVLDLYQRMGAQLYPRPSTELLRLAGPWQPYQGGLQPFETYAEATLGTKIVPDLFRTNVGYGGILFHP